jgi:hypothetical protein
MPMQTSRLFAISNKNSQQLFYIVAMLQKQTTIDEHAVQHSSSLKAWVHRS